MPERLRLLMHALSGEWEKASGYWTFMQLRCISDKGMGLGSI